MTIIENNLLKVANWNPPTWWPAFEQQLERSHRLWTNTALPEPPKVFRPRTEFEVPLLYVPDTFDNLCNMVDTPEGYAKFHRGAVTANEQNLRLAPNKVEYTEPVWLAFDPEHGKGERPDSFWGQADIAGKEVLSALIQFPEWVHAWFNGSSAPNLTGYQLMQDEEWSNVPSLRLSRGGRQLELSSVRADNWSEHFSSPSVREC